MKIRVLDLYYKSLPIFIPQPERKLFSDSGIEIIVYGVHVVHVVHVQLKKINGWSACNLCCFVEYCIPDEVHVCKFSQRKAFRIIRLSDYQSIRVSTNKN